MHTNPTRIESLAEIQAFLRGFPPVPMQPLGMGSPFLQSGLGGGGGGADVIMTVRSSEKLHQEDRHLKYIDVFDIFEVCAASAYPTVAIYPPNLRRGCAEELRRMMLSHQKLLGLLPRGKNKEVILYIENPQTGAARREELDKLVVAWFSKLLDKPIQFEMNGRRYRVPIL